jgi:hypothetical protein
MARAVSRLSPLRRLPVAKLLAAGELVLLAREHLAKLEPHERRRVAELVRTTHGRTRNLTPGQRAELAALIAKAQPRLFVRLAAEKLSPKPVPRRGRRS